MAANPAFLTWMDLTAADRDKVRRVLDLFKEQGTVDELGLGTIRDLFSDALFPGTTVLRTRLRYVLFIPWIYRSLEARSRRVSDITAEAREAELALIDALKAGGEQEGIIGAVAGKGLARLPSSAYWAALVRWGVFVPRQSQSWYHANFHRLAARDAPGHPDDPGVRWGREVTWHPHLPDPPDGLWREATFALSREEAEFVRGCMETSEPGSLLAWLTRAGSEALLAAETLWDAPEVWRSEPQHRHLVELARRFSLHVEGAPLLYNLLLAETRQARYGAQATEDERLIAHYRAALGEWAAREAAEAPFDPDRLWQLAARQGVAIKQPQRWFVERWCEGVRAAGAQGVVASRRLRDLIATRERRLKGARARLHNPNRLLEWRGGTGVGRMAFRWPQVRRLLADLHQGLQR
ncbi:DUF6361 family protein [Arhodomonas sp. SL1]|uniref:DUF6361 family protein n=1 Tax=Arhodomonas sp. SL1 TaxID=3425691 RepID=UPI003F8829D6